MLKHFINKIKTVSEGKIGGHTINKKNQSYYRTVYSPKSNIIGTELLVLTQEFTNHKVPT